MIADTIDQGIQDLRARNLEPAYIVMDTLTYGRFCAEANREMGYEGNPYSVTYYAELPVVGILLGPESGSFLQVVPHPEKLMTAPPAGPGTVGP